MTLNKHKKLNNKLEKKNRTVFRHAEKSSCGLAQVYHEGLTQDGAVLSQRWERYRLQRCNAIKGEHLGVLGTYTSALTQRSRKLTAMRVLPQPDLASKSRSSVRWLARSHDGCEASGIERQADRLTGRQALADTRERESLQKRAGKRWKDSDRDR